MLCGQDGRTKQQEQAAKAPGHDREMLGFKPSGTGAFRVRVPLCWLANLALLGGREAAQDKQQEEAATKIQALS